VDPPIVYDGPHYRGLKALTQVEADAARVHPTPIAALPMARVPVVPPKDVQEACARLQAALVDGPLGGGEWVKATKVPLDLFYPARRSLIERGVVKAMPQDKGKPQYAIAA
jgi:hypothetical protein